MNVKLASITSMLPTKKRKKRLHQNLSYAKVRTRSVCLCALLCCVYHAVSCAPLSALGAYLDSGSGNSKNVLQGKRKRKCCQRAKLCHSNREQIHKALPGRKRSVNWGCVCVTSTSGHLTAKKASLACPQGPSPREKEAVFPDFHTPALEPLSVLFIKLDVDCCFFPAPRAFPLINHSGTPFCSLHYLPKTDMGRQQTRCRLEKEKPWKQKAAA